MRIVTVSHAVFAATLIALGILGLVQGDFTFVWAPVPKAVPLREVLIYLTAFVSLASGMGLLWQRTAAVAARVLLASFLLGFLTFRVPSASLAPSVDTFWACSRTAVMVSAAWVLFTWSATDTDRRRIGPATGESGLRIARALYGLALIPFGLAHFIYLENTVTLVPQWLPAHVAWAYFTGGAFIAAGVALLTGVHARLAAALSALEMGLFGILVWLPKVAAGGLSSFQRDETIESFVLTVAAWVVSDSYRGSPWLRLPFRWR